MKKVGICIKPYVWIFSFSSFLNNSEKVTYLVLKLDDSNVLGIFLPAPWSPHPASWCFWGGGPQSDGDGSGGGESSVLIKNDWYQIN